MGLDTVEMVMEFEDEFQLSIPDDDAEKIHTVGQAFDYISNVLRGRSKPSANDPCPSARRFRAMRDDLQSTFGASTRAIRPSALICDVIPAGPLRAQWGEFARRHALPKPPFSFLPTRRFPTDQTTLRELMAQNLRGDYYTDQGEVDTSKLWKKVGSLVAEQAGVSIDVVRPESRFIDDLDMR